MNVKINGFDKAIVPSNNCESLKDSSCVYCGQCIQNCPTGAIYEKSNMNQVLEKIKDPGTLVIVQTAPSIRAALGEEFKMPIGTNVEGKMITALKELGFDRVFDTNTGADFTIIEEANEFVERFKQNDNLPMITSCCPAWVRYIEINYPELLPHLSTCKSPHQMLGAVLKSYYANKEGIDPEKICVVSVMPCIAKKYERQRKELSNNGLYDVDIAITTRELAKMIKSAGIKFNMLEDGKFDNPLGEATGAGAIFGTAGGVMEAALRTAQDTLTGENLNKIDFKEVRGEKGIKRATVNIANNDINIVTASGLANAKKIMEEIKSGEADYQFVEIMACPGGCIMGGGQPIKTSKEQSTYDIRKLRAECLYSIDEKSTIRKSHENPFIKKVYEEYLEKPGSYRAEKILHTAHNIKEE